uniref:alpha/beta fold hydrolase n=1 Tax=Castellaniella defragrans TaxID=75697 RepID=UPI003340E63E
MTSATFVLVHGAWHGGWCWSRVSGPLRGQGHRVITPTLTGLGERSHLLSPRITLDTFIQDIANVLVWEDLNDVVLVGHSFAGLVISGVADRMPQRIRHLVYLDAFVMDPGQSVFDTLPPSLVERLREHAQPAGALAVPRPESFGLDQPQDIAFIEQRLTPHPLGTYETPFNLKHPLGNGLPATYLSCIRPPFAAVDSSHQWVRQNAPHWTWQDLDTGHAAMVSAPALVLRALEGLA